MSKFSIDFKLEMGEGGSVAQNKLKQIAGEKGLRVLGPNINRYLNILSKLNLTFNQFNYLPSPVSLVSQSGALGHLHAFSGMIDGFGRYIRMYKIQR